MNRHWLIALLLTAICAGVSAQRTDFLGRSHLLLGGDATFYIGDLNNQSALSVPRWGVSAGLHTRLDNRWSVRVELSYGMLECTQDYIVRRNLSFRSSLMEGAAVVEFDFRPYGPGATESRWTPYIFGGLGVYHFSPEALHTEADGSSRWVALRELHTEGQGTSAYPERRPYQLTQLCLPFGVGFRCRLGKSVSLSAEYGFRKTWTDYIDDVSTTYVGSALLSAEVENGGLAGIMADRSGEVEEGYVNAAGIKRGDDSLNDWYSFFTIRVGFSLETLLGWTRSKRCKL